MLTTRRLALLILASFAAMALLDVRMRSTGGPGLLCFEFAGSRRAMADALAGWGTAGRSAARLSQVIDFAFIAAYVGLLRRFVRQVGRGLSGRRLLEVMAVAPVVAGCADVAQNVALLVAAGGAGGDAAPRLAFGCGVVTFALVLAAYIYIFAGRVRARSMVRAR